MISYSQSTTISDLIWAPWVRLYEWCQAHSFLKMESSLFVGFSETFTFRKVSSPVLDKFVGRNVNPSKRDALLFCVFEAFWTQKIPSPPGRGNEKRNSSPSKMRQCTKSCPFSFIHALEVGKTKCGSERRAENFLSRSGISSLQTNFCTEFV